MTTITFRSKNETLTNKQARLIIEEGSELFSLLKMTPQAEEFLKYHKQLKEAIDLW